MLTYGIYTAERMLFYTMRKNLPTENFLKIAVVDAIEMKLAEPKTLPECVNKIRTYIHDVHIAYGILAAFGPAHQNVCFNPVKVCAVLRAFANHVRTVDTWMSTKIVLLGPPSENAPMNQLLQFAVRLLGLMSERITEEKGTKQILSHTAGPTTKDKPQANAAGADTKPPGNTKKGKDNPNPNKPVPCKFFSQDDGCRKGAECSHFHPRLTTADRRCFNCGAKGHNVNECDKP
eukprot:4296317-Amphidinium_carterae.1